VETVLFIDFDGTISPVDISNTFFTRFAGADARKAVEEWKAGEIGSVECLKREVSAYRGDIFRLARYARRQPIDPGFGMLLEESRKHGVDVIVVSDGLDFYIQPFFEEHGFEVKVFSNQLEVSDGKTILRFPHYNEACGKCANCKSSHVEAEKQKGKRIIYVGDGLSDKCAASRADVVFAKGDLRCYCLANGIAFEAFENLSDVADRIRSGLASLLRPS